MPGAEPYRGTMDTVESTHLRVILSPGVRELDIYTPSPEKNGLKAAGGWDDSALTFLTCFLEAEWSSQFLGQGHRHRDTGTGV